MSSTFLDNLSRVLRLDAAERRHLYLLAHERPPIEPARTWCQLPPLVGRLVDDLAPHLAYVLNLRWDILAWNAPADAQFGLGGHPPGRRNLLWLLFTDATLRERIDSWHEEAPRLLSSFRRDYVRATLDTDTQELVAELQKASPDFREAWRRQDVHVPCDGLRTLRVDGKPVRFEHTSLTIDADRHLRLVVPAREARSG